MTMIQRSDITPAVTQFQVISEAEEQENSKRSSARLFGYIDRWGPGAFKRRPRTPMLSFQMTTSEMEPAIHAGEWVFAKGDLEAVYRFVVIYPKALKGGWIIREYRRHTAGVLEVEEYGDGYWQGPRVTRIPMAEIERIYAVGSPQSENSDPWEPAANA